MPKSKPAKAKVAAKSKPAKPAKAKPAVKHATSGRPPGATNYVPNKPLTVREAVKFRLHPDAEGKAGLKYARIYAADVASSLLLEALVKAVQKDNPDLLRLLKKLAK